MTDQPPPLPDYPPSYAAGGVEPPSPSVSTVHFHHLASSSVSGFVPPSPAASASTQSTNSTPRHHTQGSNSSIDIEGHSGWLSKLGGQVKRFKRRFFRLSGTRLEYYKDEQPSSRRLGVIPLVGATLVVFDKSIYGESSCFGLTPSQSKRTFCLRGSSEAEMQRWLSWLRPNVQRRLQDKTFFQRQKHYTGSLREGVLEQQRSSLERWSERFLVLSQQSNGGLALIYFKEVESTKPAGEIYLDSSCTITSEDGVADSPFCFAVTSNRSSSTTGQTKFVFRCSDAEEKQDWINSIQAAINGAVSPSVATAEPSASSTAAAGHHYSGSASDLLNSPTAAGGASGVEIKTILTKGDAGFQYSASESEELSDLSIDSESEEEEDGLNERLASSNISGGGRSLPPVPESQAQAPKTPPPPPPQAALTPSSSSAASTSMPVAAAQEQPDLSDRVVKEGYLRKLGAKVKNWKNRYFKLVGFVLTYHESRDVQQPVLGEIHLTGTLVKAEPDTLFNMPYTFSITQTQAGSRTYYIVAQDKDEVDDWIRVLKYRHSFAPQGLPLRFNPRVRINMNLNPDDAALRAIAVNSQPINSNYISTDADHLTYITNRIIAMGFPADGTEAVYRNDMVDVQRFFDTRHKDHYRVYNLCSERKYDHNKFHKRVLEFPFDDHNNPSFEDLPFFCQDVASFLSADEKNVACIHCKAGKGRTGLVICIFLLYCGEWQTASEAMRYYAFARTQNQKGVTISSQIRWIHYWEKYLSLSRDGIGLPKLEALQLKRMLFSKKSQSFDFFVASCHGEVISSKDSNGKVKEIKHKDGTLELDFTQDGLPLGSSPWIFLKDFQIEFFKGKLFGGSARVMSFWLHTQFLSMEPGYYLKMDRMDIDKVSKTKGIPDFTLELWFEPVSVGRKAAEVFDPCNLLSSGQAAQTIENAAALPLIPSEPVDDAEMYRAALTMMIEGRKMTRYYLGNKDLKEKEVEKKDVFIFLKDDSNQPAGSSNASRSYSLYWCLDSYSLSNVGVGNINTNVSEKITLSELRSILIGKQNGIWSRNISTKQAAEDRCFSLITKNGFELNLEAYSDRQLALWMEGIKFLLRQQLGANAITEEEGEQFQQSLLALTAGKAASSSSSSPSASSPAAASPDGGPTRERAETFARPPAIKIPENRHRRVINVN